MTFRLAILALGCLAVSWVATAQTKRDLPPASPTASELEGTWEMTSVIEDGRMLSADDIRRTLARDGRVTIHGQLVWFTDSEGKPQTRAFLTDTTANPKRVELGGMEKIGSHGIYQRDGDNLVINLGGDHPSSRPTEFAAPTGGAATLITLRRVAAATPPPAAAPTPAAPPRAERDMRQMLIGTWGHQTDREVVKTTLNTDGTFSSRRTFTRGVNKLFNVVERTNGTWRLTGSEVTLTITAATRNRDVGQIQSARIVSLTEGEVIFVENLSGRRRIEWRIR